MSDLSLVQSGFPAPIGGSAPDLLIIAGEHSGDQHAARLIRTLRQKNPTLTIAAIGGPAMAEAGAQLLFDLTHHSVVGLFEVLRSYRFFKKLFGNCVEWIREWNPGIVCFVDYPGFNLRLASRLNDLGLARKSGGDITLLYYISPQIWAWKAKRRFKMSAMLDALGVIFPFETRCYEDTDLQVDFVGHPFVAEDHKLPVEYDPNGSILLLPGSRKQAVGRILPVMLRAFSRFLEVQPESSAVILYPSDAIRELVTQILSNYPAVREQVDCYPVGKTVRARALLTSSGTISLASALAGIPGVIVYRAHLITYIIGRRLLRIPYLGIANILLDKVVYPEFIQGAAAPSVVARELADAWSNPARREQAAADARALRELLSVGEDGSQPDVSAWVEQFLNDGKGKQ